MGGSERNDNLWGGLGNDEILGYAGNVHIKGIITIGANNVTFVDMDFNHGRFPLNVVQMAMLILPTDNLFKRVK
jgi:Ca2+-binding RTX toxin-like protein